MTAAATQIQHDVDARELELELVGRLDGEVRFDKGSRGLYSRDASNFRQIPIGVVVPQHADDVVRTVEICRAAGAPILARGGGTSLAGQCVNVAVVMDCSKHVNRILEINVDEKWARVEPGTVLDDLNHHPELKKHNLTFGPDPATHNHCTFGGMIGNNSGGIHSVMAGLTIDHVHELDVLLYDGTRMRVGPMTDDERGRVIEAGGRPGEIVKKLSRLRDEYAGLIRARYPDIPRRVSGYNLDRLLPEKGFHVAQSFVGSECTCGLVLEAKVGLMHSPPHRALLVVGFPDVYTAADHVPDLLETNPIGLEGLDDNLVRFNRLKRMNATALEALPDGEAWLLVEYGGETADEAADAARGAGDVAERKTHPSSVAVHTDSETQNVVWEARESGLGASAFVPTQHDTWPGWEDSAVHPHDFGDYLRDMRKLMNAYGYDCAFYGHFGQGLLHTRIDFELRTQVGIDRYRGFLEEAADLVARYGGSFTGEHGDGQARAELLPKLYGEELLQAFREFKAAWDPDWKMNPGKVVEPYRLDENLALGTNYAPPAVGSHFAYAEDHGDFAHATLRCVGIGKCRREHAGTMCPSYQVTREEKHSTRGRAHLLYEMLQGDVVDEGWKSEAVKDALDLCLACKGCKGECPVNVDMATYKAEFLSHYFKGRLRPRHAYAMGWIYWWARIVSKMPRLVNAVADSKLLGPVAKWMGGIAPQRKMPEFADETFVAWYRRRGSRNPDGHRVILWPDTFNNFFHTDVAKAAVEVLEHAGCHVDLPTVSLCCGRPLYDFGMLKTAERMLRQILDALRDDIRAGVPIIGLEPSCVAVFRDELTSLLPHDQDARRLSRQSYLLAEFLKQECDPDLFPSLAGRALFHGHCHQKSILGTAHDEQLLDELGLDCERPDTGCCGMAGAFGFEKGHYDVSIACGERVLLPRVRDADPDTLIVADGFSCREQILQTTERTPLHLAQVLQRALSRPSAGEKRSDDAPAQAADPVTSTATASLAGRSSQRRNPDSAPEEQP